MSKRIALIVGYNGLDYYGLAPTNFDKNYPTIDGQILETFYSYGLISEHDAFTIGVGLHNATRTGKHVSATYNVIQLTVNKDIVGDVEIFKNLSASLGEKGIKLFRILNVTRSFVASRSVSKRRYSFYLPVGMLSVEDYEKIVDGGSQEFVDTLECAEVNRDKLDEFTNYLKLFTDDKKSYHNFNGSISTDNGFSDVNSEWLNSWNNAVSHRRRHKKHFKKRRFDVLEVVGIEEHDDIQYVHIVAKASHIYKYQLLKVIGFIVMSMIATPNSKIRERNFKAIFEKHRRNRVPSLPPHFSLLTGLTFRDDKFKDKNGKYVKPTVNEQEMKAFTLALRNGAILEPTQLHYFYDFLVYFSEHAGDIFSYFFE